MAKVSNETRLVLALFSERVATLQGILKRIVPPTENDAGVAKGLRDAEAILAGIVNELERK